MSPNFLVPEFFHQFLPGYWEFFGQYAGFGDGGDETGIAGPTRQHMQVDMFGDACARALAKIHSQVEAGWFVYCTEVTLGLLRQEDHFLERLRGSSIEGADMLIRNDHQVAGGVRIQVQHHEVKLATKYDPILRTAKDASGFGSLLLNILIAPGTPKV